MLKVFLIALTVLSSSNSFAANNCNILIDADTLINDSDYSYTRKQAERLVKLMQEKGYKVRAAVSGYRTGYFSLIRVDTFVNDFEGEPNLTLQTEFMTDTLDEQTGKINSGATVSIISKADGSVVRTSKSKTLLAQTDISFIDAVTASPNHIKRAIEQLPDCNEL